MLLTTNSTTATNNKITVTNKKEVPFPFKMSKFDFSNFDTWLLHMDVSNPNHVKRFEKYHKEANLMEVNTMNIPMFPNDVLENFEIEINLYKDSYGYNIYLARSPHFKKFVYARKMIDKHFSPYLSEEKNAMMKNLIDIILPLEFKPKKVKTP